MEREYITDTIAIGAETHKDLSNFMATDEFALLPITVQALYVAAANSLAAMVVSCQGIEYSFGDKDAKVDFEVSSNFLN